MHGLGRLIFIGILLISGHVIGQIQFETGNHWVVNSTKTSPDYYYMTHVTTPAVLRIWRMPTDLPIEDFQSEWMNQRYDGWVNIGREPGTLFDIQRANADAVYKAIYAKTQLTEDLQTTRILVIEYYFINNNTGYILSIETPESALSQVRPDIKLFLDQFSVGPVSVNMGQRSENPYSWPMAGKTPAQTHAFPLFNYLSDDIEINWKISLTGRVTVPPIIALRWYAVAYGKRLFIGDTETGAMRLDFALPHTIIGLASHGSLLFFLLDAPVPVLIGLDINTEQVILRQSLQAYDAYMSPLIIADETVFIQTDTQLQALNYKTGAFQTRTMPGYLSPLVTELYYITADKAGGIQAIDRANATRVWQAPYAPAVPMMQYADRIWVVTQDRTTLTFYGLDPDTGEVRDTQTATIGPIQAVTSVAVSGQYYGVLLQDDQAMNYLAVINTARPTEAPQLYLIDHAIQSQQLVGSPGAFQFIARHNRASYMHTIKPDTGTHETQVLPDIPAGALHHRLYSRFAHHMIIGGDEPVSLSIN